MGGRKRIGGLWWFEARQLQGEIAGAEPQSKIQVTVRVSFRFPTTVSPRIISLEHPDTRLRSTDTTGLLTGAATGCATSSTSTPAKVSDQAALLLFTSTFDQLLTTGRVSNCDSRDSAEGGSVLLLNYPLRHPAHIPPRNLRWAHRHYNSTARVPCTLLHN